MRAAAIRVWVGLSLAACAAPGSQGPTPSWSYPADGKASADAASGDHGGQDGLSDAAPPPDGRTAPDGAAVPETVTPPPPTGPVDPGCLDGAYDEEMPDPAGDLASAIAAYNPAKPLTFIQDALEARYPFGWDLVKSGNSGSGFGGQKCVEMFLQDTSSALAVIPQLSTIVHECGHMHDNSAGSWDDSGFALKAGLTLVCPGGGYQSATLQTFPRSLLNGDEFSALRPACGGSWGDGCDSYADTYLDGDPEDGTFDSGDQGFDMLFEEVVQYVNSLATGYAYSDHYVWSTSERDGILTFLWYLERYLRLARLEYPKVYAALTGESCWREAILSVWGRAWLYLDASEGDAHLGIDDETLEGLVLEPTLLDEIARVREKHGCN